MINSMTKESRGPITSLRKRPPTRPRVSEDCSHKRGRRFGSAGERQTQASPDEKNVASGYLADCRGPGRWARFWMGARVEREGNGEEDGCLPEPRTFWSNCSRDLRISLT
jgi:hypothetical protein